MADEFGADGAAVLGMYPAADYPLPGDAMARLLGDGQFVCEGRRSRVICETLGHPCSSIRMKTSSTTSSWTA